MSHKGDRDRTKNQKQYADNADRALTAPSPGYCIHHVHKEMECRRCKDGSS